MDRLNYDRGKLLKAAAFGLIATVLFIYIFMNPDVFTGRRARFFTSGFGRNVLIPVLTLVCMTLVWRAGTLAFGNLMAIEFTATHLTLNGYWGLNRVRWADVVSASIEANMNQPQLCVKTSAGGLFGGKAVRLPLGLTELHPSRIEDLLITIEQRRLSPAPAASQVAETESPSNFDPDAIIARYLARSAEEQGAAPASPIQPPRPTFGRKQV